MGDPRSVPEIGAADLFARALEQFDDCGEQEHRAFIRNVRVAKTRRLLNQISRVRVGELANWAGYSAILQSSAEAQTVIAEHPELRKVLDAFLDAHK